MLSYRVTLFVPSTMRQKTAWCPKKYGGIFMAKAFSDDPDVAGESEGKVTFELIILNPG